MTLRSIKQIGGLARHLHGAAETGEEGAEREHGGEQDRLIDAKRADHFAVLRRRAHQAAEARFRQRQMQQDQNRGPHRDQEQIVGRKLPPEDFDRAAHSRRAGPEQIFRSPDPQRQIVDDQHQREGCEQLEQFGRAIDPAKKHDLDDGPDHRHDQGRGDDAAPEAEASADPRGEGIGQIDSDHVEGAMRDIDDARDSEDQRQAGGDEEQS